MAISVEETEARAGYKTCPGQEGVKGKEQSSDVGFAAGFPLGTVWRRRGWGQAPDTQGYGTAGPMAKAARGLLGQPTCREDHPSAILLVSPGPAQSAGPPAAGASTVHAHHSTPAHYAPRLPYTHTPQAHRTRVGKPGFWLQFPSFSSRGCGHQACVLQTWADPLLSTSYGHLTGARGHLRTEAHVTPHCSRESPKDQLGSLEKDTERMGSGAQAPHKLMVSGVGGQCPDCGLTYHPPL